jgi:serine/threonine-protein phosphatase 2A regulatory subunit A
LMQRLIPNDIKSKVSCCYLFPVVYPKLNNEAIKKELILAFQEISKDESPSVRRAAAHNLKSFAVIEEENLLKELINLHSNLIKDTIDIVKVFAINSTPSLLPKLPSEEAKNLIKNFNVVINEDKSWRVKYAAAETICEICPLFDHNFNDQNFLPIILLLLKDQEAEVRSAVLSRMHIFIKNISQNKFIMNVLGIFKDSIVSDPNYHVRSIFASAIMKSSAVFSVDVFEKNIFPLIAKILKDDVVEVKQSALQSLEEISFFFKNEHLMLNNFLPLLHDISKDVKWRVRLLLCQKMLSFLNIFDSSFFNSYFLPIVNNFFTDHASEIREVSIQILHGIYINNTHTVETNLWPLQKTSIQSNNYIFRISSINSISHLINIYSLDFLVSTIFPTLMQMKDDKVPNVKFALCNILKDILPKMIKKYGIEKIKKVVQEARNILDILQKDDCDIDVKYFANSALKELINY